MSALIIAKLGGSLFDLPDMPIRFARWQLSFIGKQIVVIPGGGAAADVIREYHRVHRLSQEICHRLAIRMMGVNAHFLSKLLGGKVIAQLQEVDIGLNILDVGPFLEEDDRQPDPLPHDWRVTSDSIAARVALRWGGQLHLLKSIDRPSDVYWQEACARGWVDAAFPEEIATSGVQVHWWNLRREYK